MRKASSNATILACELHPALWTQAAQGNERRSLLQPAPDVARKQWSPAPVTAETVEFPARPEIHQVPHLLLPLSKSY